MAESVLFVPECHVDTALTRVLLANRIQFINHHQGITKVNSVLQAQATSERVRFVVGIVDKDKEFNQNKYLRQFTRLFQAHSGSTCRYCIYQHPTHTGHFLIVLEPACDTWIFEAAGIAGLSLVDFGLPATLAEFINVVKDEGAEHNLNLRSLLQAIRQAQPPAYRELAEFVAEIMDQNSKLWQQS